MIFGQGLLDAGAAVRGPALLNARRMDRSNYSPAAEYGRDQALYAATFFTGSIKGRNISTNTTPGWPPSACRACRSACRQMEAMYDRLAGTAAQRELDPLYSLSAAGANQALTEIYGGAQLNQANFTQRNMAIGNSVAARMNY